MNVRDVFAGGLCVVFGLFFVAYSLLTLETGSAMQMGPGYFPLAMGAILATLGIGITVPAVFRGPVAVTRPSWRAAVLISLVPIVWGLSVKPLGFVLATALASFLAVYSSRRTSLAIALLVTMALTLACVLIFVIGLGQPIPLLGTWFES